MTPTLLAPWGLALLPLALLPFLLNRREDANHRRLVSALHLWPVTPPPAARAPRPRRVVIDRRRVLLAAIIALVALAIAGPAVAPRRAGLVLVMDVSASMSARIGGTTRLDRVRDEVRRALAERPGDAVRLVSVGPGPMDRGVFAAGSAELDRALAALMPAPAGAHLGQGLAAAAALEPGAPVWIASDHPVSGVARTFLAAGADANAGITGLIAEGHGDGAAAVTAQLEHSGGAPLQATLTIGTAGTPLVKARLTLAPREARLWSRVLPPGSVPAGAVLDARLAVEGSDALPADDTRTAVVTPPVSARVRLVDVAGTAVARAIAANPRLRDAGAADADVVICRRCPADAAGPAVLQLAASAGSTATRTPLRITGAAHPVTSGLAALDATAVVGGPAEGEVVVLAGRVPAVSVRETSGRRTVTIHADDTDPAFHASPFFAVLVANAIEWLAGGDRPLALDAGEPLRWWVGSETATLTGPDGRAREARVAGGWLLSAATAEPGAYAVRTAAGIQRLSVALPASESALDAGTESLPAPPENAGRAPAVWRLAPWLLAAALLLLVVEWWHWPTVAGAVAPRMAAAGALACAAAGLAVPSGRAALTTVFVVDRSDSITPRDQLATLAAATEASRGMRAGDAAGLVTFAARPAVLRAPLATPLTADAGVVKAGNGTNIEDALGAALPLVPHDGTGRIVLATDGWETAGQAGRAAAIAATRQVAIDVMPVGAASALSAVRALRAPAETRTGEPFPVDVEVMGAAGRTVSITVEGGETRVSAPVVIGPEGAATVRLTLTRRALGLGVLRAHLGETADPDAPAAAITVLGPPRVLHVVTAGAASPLPLPPGFAVERVAPDQVPADAEALAVYPVIVLDRIPGDALRAPSAAALAEWTTNGGGLVVLGSEASLPAGGYTRPALDAVMPVDLRVAPGARTAASATVVAIDKSGSMADMAGGLQKLEAARDAVRRVSAVLAPDDTLGVVAFDVRARAVAEPGPAARGAALDDALAALTPGGGTRLAPAVETAAGWLGASGARTRHLLVVSDGRTTAEDLARASALATAARVSLSVIAIGADADRAGLTTLATRTGGRVYFPSTLADLPRLAAADVVASRGGSTVTSTSGLRAPRPHPVLAGLTLNPMPTVGGYVVSVARPGAESVLESTLGDPVLATGRAGLGRVATITTDLAHPWSASLRAWPAFPRVLAQTLWWASRRDAVSGADLAIESGADGAWLRLRLDAGVPPVAPRARLRGPDGRVVDLTLRSSGGQLFAARLPLNGAGLYRVDVEAGDAFRWSRGLVHGADRERGTTGVNTVLLEALANATGGRRLGPDVPPPDAPRPMGFIPARPVPELAALAAMLVLATGWTRRGTAARLTPPADGAAA